MQINVTLQSFIPQYLRQLEEAVKQETEHQAKELLKQAQSMCPVVTGELRNSGKVTTTTTSGETISKVEFTAPYAPRVESRHHFLYGSYVGMENDIVKAFIDRINSIGRRL